MSQFKIISITLVLLSSNFAFSQESSTFFGSSSLDLAQEKISNNLFSATNKVDSFFGEERDLEEDNGSHIKFEYASRNREYSEPSLEPDFDVKVRLKNLERKLHFKLTTKSEEDDDTLENKESSSGTSDVEEGIEDVVYRASLGFLREQKKFWSLSADSGVKVQNPPIIFSQARGRRSFYFGETEFRVVNKVLIEDQAGLFNYTDLNVKRKLTNVLGFRYNNKFQWKDDENFLSSSHGPTLNYLIDDNQSISYNIRTRFTNKPKTYAIYGHEVYSSYRRNLYKKWIFFELTPGFSFLAENDFLRTAFLNAKIQAVFGNF